MPGAVSVARWRWETRQAASLRSGWVESRASDPGWTGETPVAPRILFAGFLFDLFLELFLVLFFDLGPGIFQRHGAVEHRTSGLRIRVHAKISEAFELVAAFDRRVRERRLQLGRRDHFQRIRIQIRSEFLAFLDRK